MCAVDSATVLILAVTVGFALLLFVVTVVIVTVSRSVILTAYVGLELPWS